MAPQQTMSAPQVRELLRGVKLRCTACRIAVVQLLAESTAPLSHADAADALTPAGFDKSTIYRCLIELADAGIAARLELGDHVWRFELLRDQERVEHPHFMCLDCGKVECLMDIKVRITPASKAAPVGRSITEILLKGQCAECH